MLKLIGIKRTYPNGEVKIEQTRPFSPIPMHETQVDEKGRIVYDNVTWLQNNSYEKWITYDDADHIVYQKIKFINGDTSEEFIKYDERGFQIYRKVINEDGKIEVDVYTHDDNGNITSHTKNNVLLHESEYSSDNILIRKCTYDGLYREFFARLENGGWMVSHMFKDSITTQTKADKNGNIVYQSEYASDKNQDTYFYYDENNYMTSYEIHERLFNMDQASDEHTTLIISTFTSDGYILKKTTDECIEEYIYDPL